MAGEGELVRETWRLFQLPLGIQEAESVLVERAAAVLGIEPSEILALRMARKSLDARVGRGAPRRARLPAGPSGPYKGEPHFVVNADVVTHALPRTVALKRALRNGRVGTAPIAGTLQAGSRDPSLDGAHVAVVGAGPAGLFAALVLARNGVRVSLLERGPPVEERGRPLVRFHRTRVLDPDANLLFGEGGAGTYSDGKIYTRVDDELELPILEELIEAGAPAEIGYDSLAHIGTDRLHRILPRLRGRMEAEGVRFLWRTRLEGLERHRAAHERIVALRTSAGEIACDAVVLALGHSARDSWSGLAEEGVVFEAKPFQLGLRIEHPQELIDRARYGSYADLLGAASYNLVCRAGTGLGASHTFCMCPGGRIVASIHTEGTLCTNGMSNSRHSSGWASAALVTTLTREHFGPGIWDGVRLQVELERAFFTAGGGDYTAPAQTAADFLSGSLAASTPRSTYPFGTCPGRLDRLLPAFVRDSIARALLEFDRRIPGFAGGEGLFVGVESRSSTPIRMRRDPRTRRALGFSNLLPVGEGAGYAGGIMSAAIDGARSALVLLAQGLLIC